jgi:hypothetical protein
MPTLDYGKVPRRDPRSGDLAIDIDGNVMMLEGEELFVQECHVALDTWRGEEILDDGYGFPVNFVRKNPNMMEITTLLKSAVLETLEPQRINTLSEAYVDSVQYAGIDGEEDLLGVWNIGMTLVSINNNNSKLNIGVDAPFQSME